MLYLRRQSAGILRKYRRSSRSVSWNFSWKIRSVMRRQFANESVKDLAQESDVMIVIGGKNSSNSKKLYEIAKTLQNSFYRKNRRFNFTKCSEI